MILTDADESNMRKMLEEMNFPQAKIDEFIANIPRNGEEEQKQIRELAERGIYVQNMKEAMDMETDWKKKAVIAARIISAGLE